MRRRHLLRRSKQHWQGRTHGPWALFPKVTSVQGALAQGILGGYDTAKREISLDAGLSTHDQAHIYLEKLAHHWERLKDGPIRKGMKVNSSGE